MSNIDFITFIAEGSAEYADLLRKSCETFKSKQHKIHYKYIISGETDEKPKEYEYIGRVLKKHISSSYNHSLALNYALTKIVHEYVILVDADIALLYSNWDKIIVDELNTGIGCYGFNRAREHFPSVFLFCFKRDLLKKTKLDFTPNVHKNRESVKKYHIRRKQEAVYRHHRVGGLVKCDTGWKLPIIMKGNGKHMDCVLSRSANRKLPFQDEEQRRLCLSKSEHMAEWHYGGKLFGTHKQASRAHSLNSLWGRIWKNRIDLYTEKEFGITL